MNHNIMPSPTDEALAGPESVDHDQIDNRETTAQPTVIPDNQEPKPQNADGDSAPESRAESDTVHSDATSEAPSPNENNVAVQTTDTNAEQPKPSNDDDKTGDGDNSTPPATKEKKRRNRASPKKDSEDGFRVFMGMLPHSRNTDPVTDEMRKKLAANYESLYPRYQMEFGQCLHSSIPDSVKRYMRWEGMWQPVINFEKLPKRAVHDLNLFLKVHGFVEDKDGEGKRVLELFAKK